MDTVSACYRTFRFSARPPPAGDGGTKTPEPAGPGRAAPGHLRPSASPQRVFPGYATAGAAATPLHARDPHRAAARHREQGERQEQRQRQEQPGNRARPEPGPVAPRRLRGAAPARGACASPVSCCAAAVPPRYRAATGPGLGRAARVPPQRPCTPAGPGHGGAEAAEPVGDGAAAGGERGAARPRLSVTVSGPGAAVSRLVLRELAGRSRRAIGA